MKILPLTHNAWQRLFDQSLNLPEPRHRLNLSDWIKEKYHGELFIYISDKGDYAIEFQDEKHLTFFLLDQDEMV